MDSFVEKLPLATKQERQHLLTQKLNELAEQGQLDHARSILGGVVQLGRKWEHLLSKVLADQIEDEPTSALAQLAAPFLDVHSRADLVVRGKESGAVLQDLEGFAIISGNAAFGIHPRNPDSAISAVEELLELNVPWQGTLVALQFRLDRPLDLGPIYQALPAPDWADDSLDEVRLFDD